MKHSESDQLHSAGRRSDSPLVLIVEDEPAIARLFETLLQMEGFEPMVATRTEMALDFLKRTKPDAVILDVMLPGDSGLEVCRHIRSQPGLEGTPVIIVSARTQEEDIRAGYQAGADVYLEKPISNRHFLATVRKYVSNQQDEPPSATGPLPLAQEMDHVVLEVQRYLAEINRVQQAYRSIAEDLERSNGRSLSETQSRAREVAEHYRRQIRKTQAAGWDVLENILTRLELKDAAIRKRGSHQPAEREQWELASARAGFVKEDCWGWAQSDPDQILREYDAALADDDSVYAYLLERYGQQAFEAVDDWARLSALQDRIRWVNEPDSKALAEVEGHYDRLKPLRAQMAGVRPPDALLLVRGTRQLRPTAEVPNGHGLSPAATDDKPANRFSTAAPGPSGVELIPARVSEGGQARPPEPGAEVKPPADGDHAGATG